MNEKRERIEVLYEQQKKNIENLLEQIRLLKFELSETKKENTILKYRLEWREKKWTIEINYLL